MLYFGLVFGFDLITLVLFVVWCWLVVCLLCLRCDLICGLFSFVLWELFVLLLVVYCWF